MKKILIVEDEGILTITLEKWLKSAGYEVLDIVASAKEAIVRAETLNPDLILMDIILEGEMDGIEAIEFIHKRAYLPVIYLTACQDLETVRRANKTKPSGYLQKPVRKDDLLMTVSAVLR